MNLAFYQDLESYHAWAMGKIHSYMLQIPAESIDQLYPLGLGSLRATLQHIAGAERLWLDRWKGIATAGFPEMPADIGALSKSFADLAKERREFLVANKDKFDQIISYRNMVGEPWNHPLGELVMHVFNHGVHHRAQAIRMIKRAGLSIAGGLDYLFFRIAVPTLAIEESVVANCRQWGLQASTNAIQYIAPDKESLVKLTEYNNWAMEEIFDQLKPLEDAELNRDFSIGHGTIRRTIQHLYDGECYWQGCLANPKMDFPATPLTTSIAEFSQRWRTMAQEKRDWIAGLSTLNLANAVTVNFGAGPMHFRFSEAIIQRALHGTLHRAQITNMIRLCGRTPRQLDYVVWVRQNQSN